MRYIKMTVRLELSVPKQGPLAVPARVHVFFSAVFAHKFRVRQMKKTVADRLKKPIAIGQAQAVFLVVTHFVHLQPDETKSTTPPQQL